jgi:hypothetical protein
LNRVVFGSLDIRRASVIVALHRGVPFEPVSRVVRVGR